MSVACRRAAVLPAVVSSTAWHTATMRGWEWHKRGNGRPANCCFQIHCVLLIYPASSDRFRRLSVLQSPHVLDMVFFKKASSSVILALNKNLHITDLLIIFSFCGCIFRFQWLIYVARWVHLFPAVFQSSRIHAYCAVPWAWTFT